MTALAGRSICVTYVFLGIDVTTKLMLVYQASWYR